ncbi:MAG: YitT family protein [Eubacteriales bacterium]|nr:YitT family protein [Eubacteriales bacterium]
MSESNKIVSNKKVDEAYASYIASQNNNRIENNFKTLLAVIIGSVIMAFNMRSFIEQGNLVPGGINGVVVLIQRISEKYFDMQIPFSILSFLFNCFPAYLAYKTVGKKFTMFSCLCIAIMSVIIDFMPAYPITYDPLLIAVFGGIIQGLAISLILNAGASSGGTDFVAMYFSVKKGITTWNYVLLFNAVVVSISGLLFGMDVALYTIIFQFVQTQVLNTLYKKYAKKTVFIVTDMPQEVSEKIMAVTHHSATMYRAEGAYTHQPRYMIYTIIGADEVQQVRKQVRSVDNRAFINIMSSDTVSGNFYVRPLS